MHRLAMLLFLAMIACAGGGQGDRWGQHGPGGRPEPVTVVEVQAAGPGEVADTLQASAVVESERAASLIPSTTGVVLSIHADEGDPVQAGQLLAILDNVTLDAGAERASAEVKRLEDQVRQLEELARRGAVSDRELEDARYQLQTARTSAREATRTFGQTRLTAPFDGVVARRDVRIGELASSGTAAFEVVDLDRLRVVANLPERDLARVALGQPARLTSAYNPDAIATGRVSRIAPVVEAGSGTFRVTVDLDPGQTALRPGQYVKIDLEVDRRRDVIVVPRRAIVYEDGAPVVYVKIPEPPPEEGEEAPKTAGGPGKGAAPGFFSALFGGAAPAAQEEAEDEGPRFIARRTPVELGLVDEQHAEIRSGLEGGEDVVVLGQSHLKDGARVRTPDEAPAGVSQKPGEDGDHG